MVGMEDGKLMNTNSAFPKNGLDLSVHIEETWLEGCVLSQGHRIWVE